MRENDIIGIKAINEGIFYCKHRDGNFMFVEGNSPTYPYISYNGYAIEIRYDDHTDYLPMDSYRIDWFLGSDLSQETKEEVINNGNK